MIKSIGEKHKGMIEIDTTGPQGNAFYLLSFAKSLAQKLGLDYDAIYRDMTSGDYEHLIKVFDNHFGEYVILYR